MEDLRLFIAKYLPTKRAEHCIRVSETAARLAKLHNGNVSVVQQAGILHDVCKTMTPDDIQVEGVLEPDSMAAFYDMYPSVWHAAVAPNFVKSKLRLTDPAVLDAIQFHTTGKEAMTLETAIVYVADFIEPDRSGGLVTKCRQLAFENLDHAVFVVALSVLRNLVEKSRPIHPDSVMCFNHTYLKLSKKDRKELTRIVEKA